MSDDDDGELLDAWSRGDQHAGARLFERHYPSIARFFRNKVKATVQADLIQETFLRALKGVVGFRRQAPFRAFLFGIAHHVLADFLRQLAIGGARHDAEIEIDQIPAVSYDPTPVASVTMREEQRLLLEALRRIPMKHQIALELHYWEYLTAAQISTVLGVPLGTVKTRLRDGHIYLKRQIRKLARSPEILRSTLLNLGAWVRHVRDVRERSTDTEERPADPGAV